MGDKKVAYKRIIKSVSGVFNILPSTSIGTLMFIRSMASSDEKPVSRKGIKFS